MNRVTACLLPKILNCACKRLWRNCQVGMAIQDLEFEIRSESSSRRTSRQRSALSREHSSHRHLCLLLKTHTSPIMPKYVSATTKEHHQQHLQSISPSHSIQHSNSQYRSTDQQLSNSIQADSMTFSIQCTTDSNWHLITNT